MLKAGVKRKGVKREFGKSLLESHGKCRKVIFQFFTEAKEEGGCSHCLSLLWGGGGGGSNLSAQTDDTKLWLSP